METLVEMQFTHDKWAADNYSSYNDDDNNTRETFLTHLQTLMCFHEDD